MTACRLRPLSRRPASRIAADPFEALAFPFGLAVSQAPQVTSTRMPGLPRTIRADLIEDRTRWCGSSHVKNLEISLMIKDDNTTKHIAEFILLDQPEIPKISF